jgi:hypothetical protein
MGLGLGLGMGMGLGIGMGMGLGMGLGMGDYKKIKKKTMALRKATKSKMTYENQT